MLLRTLLNREGTLNMNCIKCNKHKDVISNRYIVNKHGLKCFKCDFPIGSKIIDGYVKTPNQLNKGA